MKVGFYSPLPPARTGVADYSTALLAELRKLGQVEVAPAQCDVALYHIGNNRLHAEIYRRALESPGVAVLHDAVLHHFLLGYLDAASYVEEFVYNYGEWNRELAQELWRARASSASDPRYFEYPMLKRIVEHSRSVVVHNPEAVRIVRDHVPSARVFEIPHLFAAPPGLPSVADAIRWRQQVGIAQGAFVFGLFGYLRESKRVMTVLQAFEEVHRTLPRTLLLVAGEFVSADLARAAEPLLARPGVLRLPHLEESEFWPAARSVDACVNLRYPAAGETSGIAIRMMGLGKPVMLTESLESSAFPEDACIRIPAGVDEYALVREHMRILYSMPEVLTSLGERAAAYIESHHRADEVAKQYWQVLSGSR